MFKLEVYSKAIVSTAVAAVALVAVGCGGGNTSTPTSSASNGQLSIDGGVSYPVTDGKTGPYFVNTQFDGQKLNHGRIPTAAEESRWNTDVMAAYVYNEDPTALGLPEGSGSVEEGEELYEAQCVMCHGDFGSGGGGYPALSKGNAYELQETLKNNRYKDPEADGPTRLFGSYWPQASTMFWYIRDGMPHPKSDTLSVDETYALTAYMLNINEMEIDGVEVDDEYVLDRAKFLKIKMPNEDGFEPNIKGPNTLPGVRAYFGDAKNFGAQNLNQGAVRCMKDCQKATAKTKYIQNGGIASFIPDMSIVRDLPVKKEVVVDAKEVYKNACAMCHSAFLSPGAPEWAGYTAKGVDKVYANGINGTEGGMPAKGGANLSDKNFKLVVDYLINGK